MARKVDDPTYSKYLLQPLNLDDLKQICRDFGIKGFSSKKKAELIDLIIDSLSEEELKDLIKEK
ncbi:MAG: Rho termination factor N-terminal domain-containing protein, partial [Candidatus Thorarchaeota archaeon]